MSDPGAITDVDAWLAELDRLRPDPDDFMADGRDQPPTPEREIFD